MKEIADLARIVTSRRLAHAPLLDLDDKNPNKEIQLVTSLLSNPASTQHQLVREIYSRTNTANTTAFRKLRSRVQAKLLNHLYFLDHSDARLIVSRRFEMELLELFHQLSALHAEGDYGLSERLLRKCLRLAQLGDFTQYSVLAARLLRNLYIDRRQGRQYKAIAKQLLKFQQLLAMEDEADQLHAETRLALGGTVAMRRAMLPKLPTYITQLEELHRKARTFNTYHVLYRVRLAHEELIGNHSEIIRITTEAARRLQQGKLNARRFDKRFNHFMIVYAYLRGRQPVPGLKLAEVYAREFHPTAGNWFYFHEYYLLLALHAGHYERAQRVLLSVLKNPFFSKLRPAALQRWDLLKAYVDFLMPPKITAQYLKSVAQWSITMPDYNRDKRGHNVAILVLQMLHYLRLRDLEAVLTRTERLRKYQQRHLREAATLRSRLFLRLLLLVVEKDFDADEIEERGQNVLKKLRAAPLPGEAYAEIEIVPYEDLWSLTLQSLREGPPMPTATAS
jgi:hypothetical protein